MSHELSEIVFLQSRRVVLRPILESDVPQCIRWINDPELRQYLSVYLPIMEADEHEWFKNIHKRKPQDVVLAIVVEGVFIGSIGLHGINMKDRVASTGTLIGDKQYQNKGYGTEAKMLLLDYAFNTLNLRKVCSDVFCSNGRSLKYAEKCGYKQEGRLKEQAYKNGKYIDIVLLAVFKKDWLSLWEIFKKENIENKENIE